MTTVDGATSLCVVVKPTKIGQRTLKHILSTFVYGPDVNAWDVERYAAGDYTGI